MIFYRFAFILIFLFFPNFGLAIWIGDPLMEEFNSANVENLNTSGAAHYRCSGSTPLPLEKEGFDSVTTGGAFFKTDYDFTLIYPRNYNTASVVDSKGNVGSNESVFGYGFKMKPFLFIHGSYSIPNPKTGEHEIRTITFQSLQLTSLSDVESFLNRSEIVDGTARVSGYFDMIAHTLGFIPSLVREVVQGETAYYVGATVSGYGFLSVHELVDKIKGVSGIPSESDMTLFSLNVPLYFAGMGSEPEYFKAYADFKDISMKEDTTIINGTVLTCEKEPDLSDENVQEVSRFFSNLKTPEEDHHLLNRTGLPQGMDSFEKLRQMAEVINQNKDQLRVEKLTLGVLGGAALIGIHRVLTRGGVVPAYSFFPPNLLKPDGYSLPEDEKYTLENVKVFASRVGSKTDEEIKNLLEGTERDFLKYFQVVVDSIQTQKKIEFNEKCLIPDFCV